ncbi:MAG: sulfite exporter TauE/SafE family protein [Hyphomicrobiales bacterium]|uniref:sulfite exporter TauE/SafE family protein n=1 Tax=Rhabdaerophilum calidifontis TaxID=2604328 RepID=UPI001238FE4C|nr:sulfite exporter TauE/SafE family protein [Rhabdaerophilum calidifontis]MCA1953487.1 sulfite exporter TauE/SafE family protein [Hyphomicrobiales bacterium]
MQLYLPIAELPLNLFLLLGMGGAIGFISGLFGVGGGFLLTPLLIFVGVPAPVAVASSSVHIAASSVTGTLNYWRRGALDVKLGIVLVIGGLAGTLFGVLFFNQMRRLGHLDLVITLSYVTLLMSVGCLMFVESIGSMLSRRRAGKPVPLRQAGEHRWYERLPFPMRFHRSKMSTSVLPLLALGAVIGFIGTVLGIGGGFLVVPALIYFFRIPTSVVVGTSLFQIVATMLVATWLHATISQAVDLLLALTLVVGGVIGAQFGARTGQTLKGEQFRLLLALLILIVGVRFAFDIVGQPNDLYSISASEVER